MIKNCSIEINGQHLNMETGRIARQASGSVVVTLGETVVLVTVVATDSIREGIDFLPLTVEYQEMSYAGGRIPGNFFRRDMGRPSERETLTSRLIDRPIRPLFPENYRYETQIIATVFSTDKENEADVLALLGASAALEISDIPFLGPIAGVRVGRVDGRFVVNPTISQQEESDINLVVAGNRTGVVMVEAGTRFVSESDILDAIFFGHEALQPMLDMQEELKSAVGKPKRVIPPKAVVEDLEEKVRAAAVPLLKEVISIPDKMLRQQKRKEAVAAVVEALSDSFEGQASEIKTLVHDLEKELVRHMILEEGKRIDGRSFTEVRPIECLAGIFPRVHGSALFTRGETQAIVLTTLGTERDEQRMESIYGDYFRSFILHYNFPPYSVGEAKRLGSPGRREIGHGALARRALQPVMPDSESFQYCVRVVSEILESNGSSSMATVCGGSLSLMDAGVPVKEAETLDQALRQAKDARLHILDRMGEAISRPRTQVSEYAPVITTIQIKPEKVRVLIGPGGKTIREISNACDVRIDVDDEGNVTISSAEKSAADAAVERINELLQEVEVGKLYKGKVVKIMDFGAFVEIFPGTDGLVHISQLDRERVNRVTDVLNEGDEVLVKVLEVNADGKIRLSRKAALGMSLDDVS